MDAPGNDANASVHAKPAAPDQPAPTAPSATSNPTSLADQAMDFKQFLLSMPDGGEDDLFARPADLPRDPRL